VAAAAAAGRRHVGIGQTSAVGDEDEWRAAWSSAAGTGRDSLAVLDALLERHRQPHRRYHGVHHVVWVLRHVHALAAEHRPADLGAIVAAACFHDAVYDPRRSDNETASADLAHRELRSLCWSSDRCAAVGTMILATAGHVPPDDGGELVDVGPAAGDADVAILLDADLAVLGADAAGYQAYVTGLRTEYAHVDDDGWRAGRGAVVRGLLARQPMFHTRAGREWWDARARANLAAELATLG